ncbi:MAG: NAD(P)H-hydrate dehydratase [Anaerolineaceae bacterium]|jgi:NAD(P)H-hydrate epimerase
MKLVTVNEMKKIEKQANEGGLTYEQMMINAGLGLATTVIKAYGQLDRIAVGLVGPGNNGGDTLVALSALARQGWQACAWLVKPRAASDTLVKTLKQVGGTVIVSSEDQGHAQLTGWLTQASVLLDGILGTGVKLPLKPEIAETLKTVLACKSKAHVVAVDCPSGVDCDSGEAAAEALPAELTVCMAAVKSGLLRFPAFGLVGRLEVVDIGLPKELESWKNIASEVATGDQVKSYLPKRAPDSHKGTFGKAVICAGSINYCGAALLAGRAAYRVGTGLVKMAVAGPLHPILAGHLPEATWIILPHDGGVISWEAAEVLKANLSGADALMLGSGWGTEKTTSEFLAKLIGDAHDTKSRTLGFVADQSQAEGHPNQLPPMVVDADGLKLLAGLKEWWGAVRKNSMVLTPHPGEMAILTGKKIEEIQANRMEAAIEYAKKWQQVVVLKGAFTIIAEPTGKTCVIPVATSALAKAGTGDVLAGTITGYLAQGLAPYEAAISGAWIHAQAGLVAAQQVGTEASVLAGDVIEAMPAVISRL